VEEALSDQIELISTGRELKGPGSALVEMEDPAGLLHTAIVFDERHRTHPGLNLGVDLVRSFLDHPMVRGLVGLSHADRAAGLFAYPTGSVWSLKEVLRKYGDLSQSLGVRAGVELAWLAGQILTEAAETGPTLGCYSHGSLDPWRISLRADGQVQIIGYGLPAVELAASDGAQLPPDAMRYTPPERLGGKSEELASDTYALALIAAEMMTGRPVYGDDVPAAVSIGRGNGIPKSVAEVLARALHETPERRLTGEALTAALAGLLPKAKGASLAELMERLDGKQQSSQRGAKLVSTKTTAHTPAQLAAQVAADDDTDETPPAADPRWAKAARKREATGSEAPKEDKPAPRRRRRRAEPEDTTAAKAPAAARRRRRRRSPDGEVDTAKADVANAAAPEGEAPDDGTPRPRRHRRGTADKKA